MSLKDRYKASLADLEKNLPVEGMSTRPEGRGARTAPGKMLEAIPQLLENENEINSLKDQLQEAKNNATPLKLALSDLHEIAGRRRFMTDEQYTDLRENLRHNQLVQAITVRPRANGGYEIISGHNRVRAFKEIGRDSIMAIVLKESGDVEAEASALYANLLQNDLTDFEKYEGIKRLMQLTGKNQKEVSASAGVSEKSVSRWMAFEDLPEAALALIRQSPDKLGGSAVSILAALSKEGKGDAVTEAIKGIVDGTLTQIAGVQQAKESGVVRSKPVKDAPVIIKSGKKSYCKLISKDKSLRIDFASLELREEAEKAIEAILRNKAKQ